MSNNIRKLFAAFKHSFFQSFKRALLEENKKTYSNVREKWASRWKRHCFGLWTPGRGGESPENGKWDLGILRVLKHHRAVRKSLDPIDPKVRNKTWMSPELCVYANNEYVFATFPIALALFCDKGWKEICESRSLTVIFTILTHCLSTTATNNYSIRTLGKWSCDDTIQKGSVPLAPVGDFPENPHGSKVDVGNVPKTFYSSLSLR